MAASTAAAPTAELTLLIDGYLAGAIIGKGGSTLKSIKSASGVETLQPMLTSTPRAGYACRPPACCTYQRHRAACSRGAKHGTYMPYAYQPRACLMYRVPWHHRLQLSQESSVATRTVSVTGHAAAIHEAYRLIAQALRAEAEKARRSGGRPSDAVRLLVPNGPGLC